MTEEIITTQSDQEIFKDHIDNLYQLFDPERKQTQEEIINFSKRPISALYVLLSFIINTRTLVELQNITDQFVQRVLLSFSEENKELLDKMISLDKQIKACCFSGKPFKECALFLNVWSEILEIFVELENIPEIKQTTDELVQKTDDLKLD